MEIDFYSIFYIILFFELSYFFKHLKYKTKSCLYLNLIKIIKFDYSSDEMRDLFIFQP